MKNSYDEDEIEIDLMEILLALKRKLLWIILAVLLGGTAAGAYSYYIIPPVYESTSMVYVISKETTLTSLADLQIGSQLTEDYQVMIKSRPVMEEVIENLGLDMEYKTLREKLSISNPSDTRIISMTVSDGDPVLAKRLVDEIAVVSSQYIGDIMELIPPKVIEDGEIALVQSSPSTKRNAALGGLVGGFLVCGLITLLTVLNDSIKSENDIERRLGLSVLSVVPYYEEGSKQTEFTKVDTHQHGQTRQVRSRRKHNG